MNVDKKNCLLNTVNFTKQYLNAPIHAFNNSHINICILIHIYVAFENNISDDFYRCLMNFCTRMLSVKLLLLLYFLS